MRADTTPGLERLVAQLVDALRQTVTAGQPELLPARAAAALCGIGTSSWHRLASGGQVPRPITLGGSVRWRATELREWIAAGCPDRRTWEAMQRGGAA